jgi:hypothetical protein
MATQVSQKRLSLPKGKIGPQFTKKILPWVELYWHNNKRYPSDIELCTRFGFDDFDLQRLHSSKFYDECLRVRGITRNTIQLTDKQVAAVSLITNFSDTRPTAAKLASIGVTAEEYNGWLSNPLFKQELTNRAEDILDNVFPEAQAALAKKVKTGDIQALKFYYEITGRAASPETVNLKLTMVRIIEAVQKHVKDPAVLSAIASEINAVAPVAEPQVPALPSTPSPLNMKDAYKENLRDRLQ